MVTEAGAAGLLLAMLPRDGCHPSALRNTRHSCFPNTTRCISEILTPITTRQSLFSHKTQKWKVWQQRHLVSPREKGHKTVICLLLQSVVPKCQRRQHFEQPMLLSRKRLHQGIIEWRVINPSKRKSYKKEKLGKIQNLLRQDPRRKYIPRQTVQVSVLNDIWLRKRKKTNNDNSFIPSRSCDHRCSC